MNRLIIATLALVSGLFLHSVGGAIEGRLFPVTDPGEITRTEQVGETWTRIWGNSHRRRVCSFERLEWRLGTAEAFSVADLRFEEGTQVRPGGAFDFGPWVVQLTEDQLRNRSFAVVYHRCHPFWLTETRFY